MDMCKDLSLNKFPKLCKSIHCIYSICYNRYKLIESDLCCRIDLFGLLGEPEVESLYVFSFGGLALFLELMELCVQSF